MLVDYFKPKPKAVTKPRVVKQEIAALSEASLRIPQKHKVKRKDMPRFTIRIARTVQKNIHKMAKSRGLSTDQLIENVFARCW